MHPPEIAYLRDATGRELASIRIEEVTDGWYYGEVRSSSLPADLEEKLAWYDEVVSGQMLSLVDAAREAVDAYRLRVELPSGESAPAVGLHVMASGEVCFRTTPIAPPAYSN
jgi:hypothetical protein